MTLPRRGTTHPEIEYLRRSSLFHCASANENIGIAYSFSFANLVEGQLRDIAKFYVYIFTHAKIELLILALNPRKKLKELVKYHDRNKFDAILLSFSCNWERDIVKTDR